MSRFILGRRTLAALLVFAFTAVASFAILAAAPNPSAALPSISSNARTDDTAVQMVVAVASLTATGPSPIGSVYPSPTATQMVFTATSSAATTRTAATMAATVRILPPGAPIRPDSAYPVVPRQATRASVAEYLPVTNTSTVTPFLPSGATPTPAVSLDLLLIPTATPSPVATDHEDITAPTIAPSATPTGIPTAIPLTTLSPAPTPHTALPDRYRARGVFRTITIRADGAESEQVGEFEVALEPASGPFTTNEWYRLTTQSAGRPADTIEVYLIDAYLAVKFSEGDWLVAERAQGSSFVKAIKPVLELPRHFLRHRQDAQELATSTIGDFTTRRYRITDPAIFADAFSPAIGRAGGRVTDLQFDAWVAEELGIIVQYEFVANLQNTPVLDENFRLTAADQIVTWTLNLIETDTTQNLGWPVDAPQPGILNVPGFTLGEFPIPPDTHIAGIYAGMPELISDLGPDVVARFYRETLAALGWTVIGEAGVLAFDKDPYAFVLVVAAEDTVGSRITILADR